MRSTFRPGASMGTSTMECCEYFGAAGSVSPMKMTKAQFGWPMPLLHHLRPLMTISSPSTTAVARMLVASLEATSGSVMQKAERIRPSSNGFSQRFFCSSDPYCTSTSMFPVSGALQLKTSGVMSERPMSSARGAYSRFESPAPNSVSGKNRFHSPAALALAFISSITGGTFQGCAPCFNCAR